MFKNKKYIYVITP